jgi:RNA polymerase sigma-70 factor (ECF subfamily)
MAQGTPDYLPGGDSFPDTLQQTVWEKLERIADPSAEGHNEAREFVAAHYWKPIYVHLRGLGKSRENAEDLTQGFLLDFFEKEIAARADREKGRFRSYLLKCLTNFTRNEHRKETALKRGGGQELLDFNATGIEELCQRTLSGGKGDARVAFDRAWAGVLVARAYETVATDFEHRGKSEVYKLLQNFGRNGTISAEEISRQVGISEGMVKQESHRLKRLRRESIRAEVRSTLGSEGDVDEEIKYLMTLV